MRDAKEEIGTYQESVNNRRGDETQTRACSGSDQIETQRRDWGARVHGTGRMCEWMILIMNKTERMMKNNKGTEKQGISDHNKPNIM